MAKLTRTSAEVQTDIDSVLVEAEALDGKAADGTINPEETDKLTSLVEQLGKLEAEKKTVVASEGVARFKLARKAERNYEAPAIKTSRTQHAEPDAESRRKAWQTWALAGKRGFSYTMSRSDMIAAADMGLDPSSNTIELSRALSKTTSNAPVPQDFVSDYSDKLKYYFPVGQAVGSLNTADGRDLPFDTVDDTSNLATIVGEASNIGSTSDPSFGTVTYKAFKYTSNIVKVSSELLQDASFDIASYLGSAFAVRHGRAYDAAVISANAGSTAPEGILHGITAAVNLASTNPVTVAKLVSLETSIDPVVRAAPGTGFVMHDATWGAIRSLATTEGLPILWGDLSNGVPPRFMGYPVYISNNMTSIGSPGDNQPLILFGNMKLAYTWRTVADARLVRLDELFAGSDQVGFMRLERVDGRLIQPSYLATLNSYDS